MPSITERDILELVGEVDPLTIARILAIGATREELEEATLVPEDVTEGPSMHLEELREILADLERDELAEPALAARE